MLQFDENGYLMPYQAIEADLFIIEQNFVFNEHRAQLFKHYLRWLDSFQSKVTRQFVQYINGSFISLKEYPKDIDFVTFFDYAVYEAQEPFLDKYWSFSLEEQGLDSYLVKNYPEKHESYALSFTMQKEWANRYAQKTLVSQNRVVRKGFLMLKFT